MTRAARGLLVAAAAVVALYAGAISYRPLNAYDLFWHLATGREILADHAVPDRDPFSFASDPVRWVDHEWLWQAGAQRLYDAANGMAPSRPPEGPPTDAGMLALILLGVVTVALAFFVAAWGLGQDGMPAAGVVLAGLLAAEVARERLMVRPETASLFFLALFLALLGTSDSRGGRSAWRRGLALGAVAALWANVHPAALIAPAIVILHAAGARWGARVDRAFAAEPSATTPVELLPRGAWLAGTLLAAGFAAAGTLVNPYGWRLWTVPFKLAALVKTKTFYNPEWLPPPAALFPLFYAALGLAVLASLASLVRTRRLPEGRLLVTLALGALTFQQMRHMGLFAIAFLMAGGATMRALDPRARVAAALSGRAAAVAALAGAAVAFVPAHAPGVAAIHESGLASRHFPVDACERIAREAPGLRLFNDVAFGGYLVWRFYPPGQVFIDGRNELYESLLRRMGRIQHPEEGAGGASFQDWKRLLSEHGIDGAILKDKGEAGMVSFLLPPASPQESPRRVRRAFSAVYFPSAEWALVYFDDTAMVFVRRGSGGQPWVDRAEYRVLNPEDAAFVLEKAAHDPAFASQALAEAERRVKETPPSQRAEDLFTALRGSAIRPSGHPVFPAPR